MSEKSLNDLGKEAERHYRNHRAHSTNVNIARGYVSKANGEDWDLNLNLATVAETQEESQALANGVFENEELAYTEQLKEGSDFAKEHAGELHDIGVIEAHMAGVAINVEQPVTVGQKVEAHTLEK